MSRFSRDLEAAIRDSGLKDGMRISFHHHLRLGDRVVEMVLAALTRMGLKDLTFCVSSVMGPACEAVLDAVRAGVVARIETTGMKEPLSSAVAAGEIPEPVVFRTHGGRARAIETGETPISVAFIAASATDEAGNVNGVDGPNRFGSMGYAQVDAEYASHVIVITDHVSESPLGYVSIPAGRIHQIVVVESIGEKELIAGGSLRFSRRPIERLIAAKAVDVLIAGGSIREGLGFQAGSGGISLLVSRLAADYMRQHSIKGEFASGGVTGALTSMLAEGLFSKLYDVQSFDDQAAISLGVNPNHVEMSASEYANPDRVDCIAHRLDVMVLSATEIDHDFNVNSLTGANGRILGALGGAPDTAAGAGLTMVVLPTMRGRIPTVNPSVNTVCTPGSAVDVLVTERGICVNPRREDLLGKLRDAGIETIPIPTLTDLVYGTTGVPTRREKGNQTVAVVESRDGKILDTISQRD